MARSSSWACHSGIRKLRLAWLAIEPRRLGPGDGDTLGSGGVPHRVRPLEPEPRDYMRPTMWPSGSAKSAIVVSGATWVSGMITLPPSFSTFARVPFGSSECT